MCFIAPPVSLQLNDSELHIWYLDTANVEPQYLFLSDVLSNEESKRAGAFYFKKHSVRFIIARAFLRILLARYLGCSPFDLVFDYGKFGKPQLKPGIYPKNINFNLSHSHNGILYAFYLNKQVGIDLEKIAEIKNLDDVARYVLSEQELNAFFDLPEKKRKRAFFWSWTRREALYKALGLGIGSDFYFSLCLLAKGSSQIISAKGFDWLIQDLQVADGFTAAFCIENHLFNIEKYFVSRKFVNNTIAYLKIESE